MSQFLHDMNSKVGSEAVLLYGFDISCSSSGGYIQHFACPLWVSMLARWYTIQNVLHASGKFTALVSVGHSTIGLTVSHAAS